MSEYIPYLAVGIAAAVIGFAWARLGRSRAARLAEDISRSLEEQKALELEALLKRMEAEFGKLSREALGRNTDDFLKLAAQALGSQAREGEKELESKKKLIDQSVKSLSEQMEKIRNLIKDFEKDRSSQYGALVSQIRSAGEITARLDHTTSRLTTALSGSRQRGQWGERMAEDILRFAGFLEGKQYDKQRQVEGSAQRPDFTFYLPQGRVLNMDVKFPFDNYLHALNAGSDAEKTRYKSLFMRDIQNRIKEVKEYINPVRGTLDYALMFIPNEQVYAFVQEEKPDIVDAALREKVILCSPFTLYAILAVVRQAMDNFNLEQKTAQILSCLGEFGAQWGKFVDGMDKLGKKILDVEKEFQSLVSTRRNMLERPLRKIDSIRREKELEGRVLPAPEEVENAAPDKNPRTDTA